MPPGLLPEGTREVRLKKRGLLGIVRGDYGLAGTVVDFAMQLAPGEVLTDEIEPVGSYSGQAFAPAPNTDPLDWLILPVVVQRDVKDIDSDGITDEMVLHRIVPESLKVFPLCGDATSEELIQILSGKARGRGHCSSATITALVTGRIRDTQLIMQQVVRIHSLGYVSRNSLRVICSDPTNPDTNQEIEGLFLESRSPFRCDFGTWTGIGPMTRGPMAEDDVQSRERLSHLLPGGEAGKPKLMFMRPVLGRTTIGDSTAPVKFDGIVCALPTNFDSTNPDESMAEMFKRLHAEQPQVATQMLGSWFGHTAAICGDEAWDGRLLCALRTPELPVGMSPEMAHRQLGHEFAEWKRKMEAETWRPSNVFRPRPYGARGNVGGTGGQEHFGVLQGGEAIPARRPLLAYKMLRASTFHLRPGKYYEANGYSLVTINSHPNFVTWSNQKHFVNPRDGWSNNSDSLGKDRLPNGRFPQIAGHGWDGTDDQHAGALPAQIAGLMLGCAMMQIEAIERIEVAKARYEDGADRARGRMAKQLANDSLITGSTRGAGELAETIRHARDHGVDYDGPIHNRQIIKDPRGLRESASSNVPVPCTYGWQNGLGAEGVSDGINVLVLFGERVGARYAKVAESLREFERKYLESNIAHYEFDPVSGRPVSIDQLRFDGSGSELPDDEFHGIGSFHPVYHTTGWFDGNWSYSAVLTYLARAKEFEWSGPFVEKAQKIVRWWGTPKTFDEADWRATGVRSLPAEPT